MLFRVSLVAAAAAVGLAATASAQTPAAPAAKPAANPGLGGPVVPGVCLLSREAIFANAKVSQAANARLKQLADEAQAEVDNERRPLDAELQSFQNDAAKLPADQRQAREQALAQKLQPIQVKAAQRGREIELTRAKALERIANEAEPVIAQVYKSKNCGLLVDRSSVLGGNMANDLTSAVVQGLDAKITTITFNRETLPAQAAQAPAQR